MDWAPQLENPSTDYSKNGMGGFSAYIQNNGLCYDSAGKATDKTCSYSKQGIDAFCHEKCKTNSLDVQACGDLATKCITTGPKDHWKWSGCADDEICGPSLATMASPSGLIFGIVNIVGNFGTVFVDQSYWQSAIAVKPEMAASGYILGGVVWFAVPMMMGSTHGLVGRALTMDSSLVNGAAHITAEDSGSGLTPARVAVAILGEGGAWILLLMLFMAIVSTGCAEIIAVATILTYDVYCEYIKPELKEPRMKARSLFYSTLLGKSEYTVEEQADKSVEKIAVTEVGATLDKLEAAGILAEAKFEEAEKKAVEGALAAYVEKDGTVTCELVYFAVQSQVLAKKSLESGVMLRVMKFFCVCFAVFMGFNAVFLQTLGLGLGFVYMSMGILGST